MTKRHGQTSEIGWTWTPETIPWGVEGLDGTRYALLEGDRDVAGATFSYAFFLPAGFWDPPHWHTRDARVVVVAGALRFAFADQLDPVKALEFPTGSVLHVPAHVRHFDGATEDTVIVGVAHGVWRTKYVNPNDASSAGTPADLEPAPSDTRRKPRCD